jgi:hypothetical protein
MTKQAIEDNWKNNIARVRRLISAYDALSGTGPGRASVADTDVLRAAVVFLHATVEDFLRSLEAFKLPSASGTAFNNMRYYASPGQAAKDGKDKFTLVDLAANRGQSVDDVFRLAISRHLEMSNYNNVAEVRQALHRSGVNYTMPSDIAANLEALTKRRHWIAHRADKNPMSGSGHHRAQSIGKGTVEPWTTAVESFCSAVTALI